MVKKKMVKHGLTAEKEKTILVAIVGVVVLGLLVWFSQDFPAQGQAYSLGLDLEQAKNLNVDLVRMCDSPRACALVEELAESLTEGSTVYLRGKAVSVYELTFYGADGIQVTLKTENDWYDVDTEGWYDVDTEGWYDVDTEGWGLPGDTSLFLDNLGIKSVGFEGKRYPASMVTIAVEK